MKDYQMNFKQRNEQRIFDTVYGNTNHLNTTHGDKPDFLVSLVDDLKFGVEITEFFQSESQARLNNIPSYISELLDGKSMRHKDDK